MQEHAKIRRRGLFEDKKNNSEKALCKEGFQSGIPPHLAGYVKVVLDDLVKEGIVLYYGKTKHGDAYQLNIARLKDIEDML
ncbi:MAG: hypothetical protein QME12_05155 [Nanoarchaeota archaeon]|nr:hypothetical protein [Nanoarchaeota archaeon]